VSSNGRLADLFAAISKAAALIENTISACEKSNGQSQQPQMHRLPGAADAELRELLTRGTEH